MEASGAPRLGDTVDEMLTREGVGDEGSVTLLVGLDERHEGDVETLREILRSADGEIVRDLGFDIYRISVPQSSLDHVVGQTVLEYVECPDEEGNGAPQPMGN